MSPCVEVGFLLCQIENLGHCICQVHSAAEVFTFGSDLQRSAHHSAASHVPDTWLCSQHINVPANWLWHRVAAHSHMAPVYSTLTTLHLFRYLCPNITAHWPVLNHTTPFTYTRWEQLSRFCYYERALVITSARYILLHRNEVAMVASRLQCTQYGFSSTLLKLYSLSQ